MWTCLAIGNKYFLRAGFFLCWDLDNNSLVWLNLIYELLLDLMIYFRIGV